MSKAYLASVESRVNETRLSGVSGRPVCWTAGVAGAGEARQFLSTLKIIMQLRQKMLEERMILSLANNCLLLHLGH
jgi:hypothetical protein